jgi:hypothetical protein
LLALTMRLIIEMKKAGKNLPLLRESVSTCNSRKDRQTKLNRCEQSKIAFLTGKAIIFRLANKALDEQYCPALFMSIIF